MPTPLDFTHPKHIPTLWLTQVPLGAVATLITAAGRTGTP